MQQTLRQRWWLAPLAIGLVALAVIIKIITTPLEVSASVNDGDQSVPRNAAIDLKFNQDMKPDTVRTAFAISPTVPVAFKQVSPKEFQFRPKMQPATRYQVRLDGAEATGGGHVSNTFSFKTEAAPAVTTVTLNGAALKDGQQSVHPTGQVQIAFSQPMDGAHTPVLVNTKTLDPSKVKWSGDNRSATLDLRLGHSRAYALVIPQSAVNAKQDQLAADWKFTFTTVIEVPSAGDPARIGGGAPALIQIENSGAARPQAGMQQADMVYEYISEGSIPRLTAVYWHPLPGLVGPVRSCRLITIRIELMYHGMIYCSGANDYVLGMVWKFPNLVNDYAHGAGGFFRDSRRFAPHNVMLHGDATTAATASKNLPALTYDIAPAHPDATVTGDPATQISVPDHQTVWRYDAGSKQYLKWQDGAPLRDVATGQVHAKTVVVQYVTSFLDMNPANSFHGYHTEAYEMTGQGQADVYVNGVVMHATWFHPDPNVPTIYLDANGNPIDFDTGLTWVHVIGSTRWQSGL
jgi:hypothetical protein